jgi:pimeloyl-ACP methyl ester carboxylesterase
VVADTLVRQREAWYLPPSAADKPAPAVIFGHGNGELIDYWPNELARFSEMGIGLLLVEFPGYGRSAGSPSQARIAETFILAYDRLAARTESIGSHRLFGRSSGGALRSALKRPSAALILMSC